MIQFIDLPPLSADGERYRFDYGPLFAFIHQRLSSLTLATRQLDSLVSALPPPVAELTQGADTDDMDPITSLLLRACAAAAPTYFPVSPPSDVNAVLRVFVSHIISPLESASFSASLSWFFTSPFPVLCELSPADLAGVTVKLNYPAADVVSALYYCATRHMYSRIARVADALDVVANVVESISPDRGACEPSPTRPLGTISGSPGSAAAHAPSQVSLATELRDAATSLRKGVSEGKSAPGEDASGYARVRALVEASPLAALDVVRCAYVRSFAAAMVSKCVDSVDGGATEALYSFVTALANNSSCCRHARRSDDVCVLRGDGAGFATFVSNCDSVSPSTAPSATDHDALRGILDVLNVSKEQTAVAALPVEGCGEAGVQQLEQCILREARIASVEIATGDAMLFGLRGIVPPVITDDADDGATEVGTCVTAVRPSQAAAVRFGADIEAHLPASVSDAVEAGEVGVLFQLAVAIARRARVFVESLAPPSPVRHASLTSGAGRVVKQESPQRGAVTRRGAQSITSKSITVGGAGFGPFARSSSTASFASWVTLMSPKFLYGLAHHGALFVIGSVGEREDVVGAAFPAGLRQNASTAVKSPLPLNALQAMPPDDLLALARIGFDALASSRGGDESGYECWTATRSTRTTTVPPPKRLKASEKKLRHSRRELGASRRSPDPRSPPVSVRSVLSTDASATSATTTESSASSQSTCVSSCRPLEYPPLPPGFLARPFDDKSDPPPGFLSPSRSLPREFRVNDPVLLHMQAFARAGPAPPGCGQINILDPVISKLCADARQKVKPRKIGRRVGDWWCPTTVLAVIKTLSGVPAEFPVYLPEGAPTAPSADAPWCIVSSAGCQRAIGMPLYIVVPAVYLALWPCYPYDDEVDEDNPRAWPDWRARIGNSSSGNPGSGDWLVGHFAVIAKNTKVTTASGERLTDPELNMCAGLVVGIVGPPGGAVCWGGLGLMPNVDYPALKTWTNTFHTVGAPFEAGEGEGDDGAQKRDRADSIDDEGSDVTPAKRASACVE